MNSRKRASQVITQLEINRGNKKLSKYVTSIIKEALSIDESFNLKAKISPVSKFKRLDVYYLLFFISGAMLGTLLITYSKF